MSVNSFGFGGSNVHVVLDDAYNYLRLRGLPGNHSTRCLPPSLQDAHDMSKALRVPTVSSARAESGENGISDHARPKLLILSASDESGVNRLAKIYEQHFSSMATTQMESDYLRNLAYTLHQKRSSLMWKSFTIAKSVAELQENL